MKANKAIIVLAALLILLSFSAFAIAEPQKENLREKIQQKIENAKQNFEKAQERFEKQKDKFEDAKTKWVSFKTDWQSGKNKDKNRLYNGAKNYIVNATERMENYLEVTKRRAQNIQDLPEADLNSIVAQIDAEAAKLALLKSKVNDANSNEAIKALVPEVNAEWDLVKAFSKKITGLILSANTQKAIDAAEKISQKAQDKINELDANSTADLNAAKARLAQYQADINLAIQKKQAAVAKFLQITDSNNAQPLFKEGQDLLKEAHKELRNAAQDLKDIIRDIVKANRPERPKDSNSVRDQNEQD
ncbi:MAG: hypothetical protein Q7R70_04260 [Candidatus Diapherotrites archaeon]|nr:hypothetical protein [Candidatus Diapherotrites archaeon]